MFRFHQLSLGKTWYQNQVTMWLAFSVPSLIALGKYKRRKCLTLLDKSESDRFHSFIYAIYPVVMLFFSLVVLAGCNLFVQTIVSFFWLVDGHDEPANVQQKQFILTNQKYLDTPNSPSSITFSFPVILRISKNTLVKPHFLRLSFFFLN